MTRTRAFFERAVTSDGPSRLGLFSADAAAAVPRAASEATTLDLRALFDAHYASIWRLLRRLGVRHGQLDDASQEVFWVAARRLADIRAGSEHAFLYGVALRVASDAARRRYAEPQIAGSEPLEQLAIDHPNPGKSGSSSAELSSCSTPSSTACRRSCGRCSSCSSSKACASKTSPSSRGYRKAR